MQCILFTTLLELFESVYILWYALAFWVVEVGRPPAQNNGLSPLNENNNSTLKFIIEIQLQFLYNDEHVHYASAGKYHGTQGVFNKTSSGLKMLNSTSTFIPGMYHKENCKLYTWSLMHWLDTLCIHWAMYIQEDSWQGSLVVGHYLFINFILRF